ncbi:TPA: hypothetical protein DEP34_00435 [Candidatus Uhrbacteria bacterium]|uniref:Uncharacterized protein n=2 Tax=Candidatus Uhriibacteriota TaxID=1752732 RepID=A0A0G1SGM6_9BACT|nr:MAG: hypothetical protein UX45_C0003G0062 [Candidatus Uhrbacteria bacterium GW2011_GWF2_46_218]KKU41233.1 MAG: hypothetical protein UX57_C0005G0063 [Candidatus Uhrbacteria bacterium GW2011_GWE2_46_68]HBK34082.1 hypothetical protein [Candidatus Uhrbacteria bacterium]HCB18840.1 hypothetical protein [Candidatus Uhrbacteria bacterium]
MAVGGASPTEQNRRSQYLRDRQKKHAELLAAAQLRFAKPKMEALPTVPSSAPYIIENKPTTIPYEPSEHSPIPLYPDGLPEETEEETSNEEGRRMQFASTIAKTLLTDDKEEKQNEEKRKQTKLQKEIKKKAETGARRGAIYLVDFISSALNIGSSGVAFLIDWIFFAFSFAYLNLELFYGKYIMKGKDPFISEPSWDPLPLPLPNEYVDMGIIAADIILVILVLTAAAALIIIVAGAMALTDHPLAAFVDFLGMGISVFQ